MKNWFKILIVIFSMVSLSSMNGMASSMMNSMEDESANENENEDAVSKWGQSGNRLRGEAIAEMQPLQAIEESSFEVDKNRAPASMREPAASKPKAAKKPLPTAKTMQRTMREKKAHQEAALIVNDLGFFPSTLFLTQGVPVRLFVTGASKNSQCIIIDSFGIRRQIRSNKVEEVTFTPDQIGKFSFNCPMNGAKGNIVVKELEVFDRFPASEGVDTSMSRLPSSQSVSTDTLIRENDFDPEFRKKN